ADIGIGLDALARRRRNLCENDLVLILRILLKESPEGLEFLRQALGVVEGVGADNAAPRKARRPQTPGGRCFGGIRPIAAHGEACDRDQSIDSRMRPSGTMRP